MKKSFSYSGLSNKENIPQLKKLSRLQIDSKQREPNEHSFHAEECYNPQSPRIYKSKGGLTGYIIDNILLHLRTSDFLEIYPVPNYIDKQIDIDMKMRSILIDWLVDVTFKFKMLPQTVFMTVSLIDRYLSLRQVSHKRLQLVGISALMIIGKYEEIYPPSLKDYLSVCCNIYSAGDILEMESDILLATCFELNKVCSYVFLEFFKLKEDLEEKAFMFCQYFLEIALLDTTHLYFKPSELAAGSIYLMNKLFKRSAWTNSLKMTTGVSESKAKMCAKELFSTLEKIERSDLKAVTRKYNSEKFYCISKYKIERIGYESSK